MRDKHDEAPASPPVSRQPGSGRALIDWATLESRYARRPQFVERLAAITVAATRETPARLRQLAETWRTADIAAAAHSVRSTADVIVALGVRDLAARVESACRANASDAIELTLLLADAVDQLLMALRTRLGTETR